jgi:hypothetical protein
MSSVLNFYDSWDVSLLLKLSDFTFDHFKKEIDSFKKTKSFISRVEKYQLLVRFLIFFLITPESNLKGNFGKIVEKNSKVFVMKISEQIQTNMAPLVYEIRQNPGKVLNEDEKQLISKLIPLMDWMFLFTILFFKSTHFLFSTEKENSYLKTFLYGTGILATPIDISVEILSKSESTLTSCFKISEMKEIQKMINGNLILIKFVRFTSSCSKISKKQRP